MRKISNLEIYGYLWILTLILVILKLSNIIGIDWIFIFAPLWLPAVIIISLILLILITSIISTIVYRGK